MTEAQVFKPERDAFDEVITMRLLPVLGFQGYRQRSHPLVIEDPTLKLQGLEVIQGMDDQVEPADLVEEVNEIVRPAPEGVRERPRPAAEARPAEATAADADAGGHGWRAGWQGAASRR